MCGAQLRLHIVKLWNLKMTLSQHSIYPLLICDWCLFRSCTWRNFICHSRSASRSFYRLLLFGGPELVFRNLVLKRLVLLGLLCTNIFFQNHKPSFTCLGLNNDLEGLKTSPPHQHGCHEESRLEEAVSCKMAKYSWGLRI